jgi:cellulose synthase/poly-beta-1,6-N-acetylglucosamine synthase-like glycosyltransferase
MTPSAAPFFFFLVVLGMTPMVANFGQFLLIGLHGLRNHYRRCRDYTPRVAFILPAWNEADVIGASIDSLMSMSYPAGAWRVYVVDDASTDDTPSVMREKMAQYPGSVHHLRREKGGQGKAHTLNHGLREILSDDWAEAVMIMDADVLFEPVTLRRMARHLADPRVGAVTAYIKEGSVPGNMVTRCIAFEYITAQAASRRAQNVMGVVACLAGGAQLHTRASMLAIGGMIDTSTLAEDTYTTFKTQLRGRKVVFDGNAVVWAEEPGSMQALWKQRLRWARGNLQLTTSFRGLWFQALRHSGLGGIPFGILWFSIVLTPGLEMSDSAWAWQAFGLLGRTGFVVFIFETLFSFIIDPATARRAWIEGMTFPGLITLAFMLIFFIPPHASPFVDHLMAAGPGDIGGYGALKQFMYGWVSLCMLAAWGVYRVEKAGAPAWLRDFLMVLVGYGPFMCVISFTALATHWQKREMKWDKTVKSGKVRVLT